MQIQIAAPECLHIAYDDHCLVQLELQGSHLYPLTRGGEVYVHLLSRPGRPFLPVPPEGVQVQDEDEIIFLCRPPLTPSSSLGDATFHCLGHDANVCIPLKRVQTEG